MKKFNVTENQKLEQLRSLSILLDSQFEGPLGFRFGLDGLIGLIPIVGDLATTLISLYIIFEAAKLGCSQLTLMRMGMNVTIENLLEVFPIFGTFFDFAWKSNNKNIALLEKHLKNPKKISHESKLLVLGICFGTFTITILMAVVAFHILKKMISFLAFTHVGSSMMNFV